VFLNNFSQSGYPLKPKPKLGLSGGNPRGSCRLCPRHSVTCSGRHPVGDALGCRQGKSLLPEFDARLLLEKLSLGYPERSFNQSLVAAACSGFVSGCASRIL